MFLNLQVEIPTFKRQIKLKVGFEFQVDWPYQVASVFATGKWALYLMEAPTMQLTNTDNSKDVKQCTMVLPHEWINPLQLKFLLETENEHYYEEMSTHDDDIHEEDEVIDGLNRIKVS